MRLFLSLATLLLATSALSADTSPVATTALLPSDEAADEELSTPELSVPEDIASSHSSHLIGGLISPVTGLPAIRETDLLVRGAQELPLNRVYISPYMPRAFFRRQDSQTREQLHRYLRDRYRGWQSYPHLLLRYHPDSHKVRFTDPNGASLAFQVSQGRTTLCSDLYGISNVADDTPSGRYDPRNTRISIARSTITVHSPDGTERLYTEQLPPARSTRHYLLEEETLPNGKLLRYGYTKSGRLTSVESRAPGVKEPYASIQIDGSYREGSCRFVSSSGQTVETDYHESSPLLTRVSSPNYRNESLEYNDQFLLSDYSGRTLSFQAHHAPFGQDAYRHYRVDQLSLPVGQDGSFEPIYTLSYEPAKAGKREGTTTVVHRDGTMRRYQISKQLLISAIEEYGADAELKRKTLYHWSDSQWLEAREIWDGSGQRHSRTEYQYDRFGNPIAEVLIGNLTGDGAEERFVTRRQFSSDARNLLLREETEDGKVTCYSYLPNSNLITSKLIKDQDRTLLREFFTYDACRNLVQTISDDGSSQNRDDLSGVTQRTSTRYQLRQTAPFLHMPEWVEESCLEQGKTRLIRKRHLTYDAHGNVAQEEVYDAQGNRAYTLERTYNERGDLLTETNPLGQRATYTYDPKGRLESATSFSGRMRTQLHRDANGRIREQVERGDDGISHTTSWGYDLYGRKIRHTDYLQHTTHTTYDPLVNQVIRTDYPAIATADGEPLSVASSAIYDPFGNPITQTNANGQTRRTRYNAYGSPTEIRHPGGAVETLRYNRNGTLHSATDPDGLTTQYERDVLGRVLSKTYIFDDQTPAQETSSTSGFNLLSQTDKEGKATHFAYDGAGRKIREECSGRVTEYKYNALGQLSTVCKHNGTQPLLIHYEKDLEGRILEERHTDSAGQTLYRISTSYDEGGYRQTVTRHINGHEAVTRFNYDSFGRLIQETDPEGNVTCTQYDEKARNLLGQRVLQITTTDPRQIRSIDTHDALSRTIKQETRRGETTLSCREMVHDPVGNLTTQRDQIYEDGQHRSTQTIQCSYTADNRLQSVTRASARTTQTSYLPSGKRASKTLPDGVILTYSYHPLGYLHRIDSSDGQIHHVFETDRLGRLRSITDDNQKLTIQRELDPFDNVLRETFPHIEIIKEYDAFGRPTSLHMGLHGTIRTSYDPLFPQRTTRLSSTGATLYEHRYDAYDEDGNLTSESLIGNLGTATYHTNLRGRTASISSPHFSQECQYDSVGNLTQTSTDKQQQPFTYDDLSQLTSDNAHSYAYDSLYNRTLKNDTPSQVNPLNELLSNQHDLNGNQTLLHTPTETFQLTYDPLSRLIEAKSENQTIRFTYDPLGRRLSKTSQGATERYIYDGKNEIGAVDSAGQATSLRVVQPTAHGRTVAIELNGKVFASITDVQGNIRRLIPASGKATRYDFTPFGEPLSAPADANPWRYASKRLDPELHLIYFGHRYYDPYTARWLTIDPAGFLDSPNLYQYVFNNPLRYQDPDGQFAILFPLFPILSLSWEWIAAAVVTYYIGTQIADTHVGQTAVDGAFGVLGCLMKLNTDFPLAAWKEKNAISPPAPTADDIEEHQDWKEVTHPDQRQAGHREFENVKTGEKWRFDQAKPGEHGHKGQDHWHAHNPDPVTGRKYKHLDANGNPCGKNSDESHLYYRK